mmetsp:Transcript_7066/g.8788  ORF Transcript_7066/g.8788 Transcript_7066/m.8788 type:complete len:207 (+) Transcript_7066:108-728(+)
MNYGTTNNGDEETKGSSLVPGDDSDTSFDYGKLSSWLLDSRLEAVMLVSVILNGMAAGIIFIFSNTIMPSLATLDSDVGINIMNTINVIIVNPLFIIAFFGGLVSAYPARVMWKNPDLYSVPARYYSVASTLIFFFGEFMVTATQNVPRNNALLAVDPESDDGVSYWQINFLKGWVAWNTARGIFAAISAVLGALSLSFMRKPMAA